MTITQACNMVTFHVSAARSLSMEKLDTVMITWILIPSSESAISNPEITFKKDFQTPPAEKHCYLRTRDKSANPNSVSVYFYSLWSMWYWSEEYLWRYTEPMRETRGCVLMSGTPLCFLFDPCLKDSWLNLFREWMIVILVFLTGGEGGWRHRNHPRTTRTFWPKFQQSKERVSVLNGKRFVESFESSPAFPLESSDAGMHNRVWLPFRGLSYTVNTHV